MTPDQYTISEHFLEVGNGHTLYVQEWGNPNVKVPIIFLHGGPGSQVQDKNKGQFDPQTQRVIFHDQRGSGKCLPYGSIKHNTTKDLIDDVIRIASKLNVDQFILTGGSWGACLSLAVALAHPSRVKGMVISGIFTGSQKEIDWFEHGRFQTFFPDVWETYLAATPKAHHNKPGTYHFNRALGSDAVAAKQSAYTYENLEGSIIKLDDRHRPELFDEYDPAGIRIEMHYLKHGCFMPDRYILDNAHKLTMPVYLVQGRYDMVCPPETAYELSQKLPNGELFWTIGGHMSEHEGWNVSRALLSRLCQ